MIVTMRKDASSSTCGRHGRNDRLKDEVYRHMFRLESHRPGAECDLAVALLRVWIASDAEPDGGKERQWLKKICPICLTMIESALKSGEHGQQCAQ